MQTGHYRWNATGIEHELRLARVAGTAGDPFLFGREPNQRPVEIPDFQMMTTPVTQALWKHVMGSNPAEREAPLHPMTNISWEQITCAGGFLERINAGEILAHIAGSERATRRFRLPTETEWEYAARGGPHWRDGFRFSGSNDIDRVAWYGFRFAGWRPLLCRLLGWRLGWRIAGRFPRGNRTNTHEVGLKAPNQLGIHDLCGNVWEWCEDTCVDDLNVIPRDGTAYLGSGAERRLRGGCHQNWDIHCTVWFRYGIAPDAHDGCIGFRLVLSGEGDRVTNGGLDDD